MRDLLLLGVSMGRELAEARMLDTCRIRRVTGTTEDELTGAVTAAYAPVYDGPCRVVDSEGVVATPEVAGATLTLRRTRVDIPVGAADVQENDVVEVTSSATFPEITGATGRITSVPIGTQVTAHRLGVQEVA